MAAPNSKSPTVQTALPGQPSKKRPKYAPGSGTPKTRAIMLGIVALCFIAVFLIQKSEEDPDLRPPGEAVEQAAPPAPPSTVAAPTPESRIPRGAILGGNVKNDKLPSVREVTIFAPTTAAEVDKRIDTLTKYYSHSDPKEREAAFKATVDLKNELLPRLPKLIETSPPAPLTNYALAAKELNAVNTVAALIARIEAKDKPKVARFEMFSALASFDDAKARAYVMEAMKKSAFLSPTEVWNAMGTNMNDAQVDLALQTVAAGGPDAKDALTALGRYGSTYEKAQPLVQKIQTLLTNAKGPGKLALVQALAKMEPSATGNVLMSLSFEQDQAIKIAALVGMVRNPAQQNMTINAFRNENDPLLKRSLLKAFAENPPEAMLPDMLKLLNDPDYKDSAHQALVAANKGIDKGTHDYDWAQWLREKATAGAGKNAPVQTFTPPPAPAE